MRRTTTRLAGRAMLSLAIAAAAVHTGAASPAPPVPAAGLQVVRGQAKPLAGVGLFRLGSTYRTPAVYRRYAYLVVGRHNARSAARLPGRSLVYMSGADVSMGFDTGVSYDRALARGWLARDQAGQLVARAGYPGVFLADVGNAEYQRDWLRNVLAFLRATKVDGVYVDDVIADARTWSVGGVAPARYPTQLDWEAAMLSFVNAVGPELRRRGYYVLLNAHKFVPGDQASNDGTLEVAWWRSLAPAVSGLLTEYWMQSPVDPARLRAAGPSWEESWAGWQRLVAVAQRAGVDFFGFTYGPSTDLRALRFGRASFLLDWHGAGGAFVYHPTDGSDPPTSAFEDLGAPVRAKVRLAPGVWRRRFERGIVVVNATAAPVTARVAGVLREIGPVDSLVVPI